MILSMLKHLILNLKPTKESNECLKSVQIKSLMVEDAYNLMESLAFSGGHDSSVELLKNRSK